MIEVIDLVLTKAVLLILIMFGWYAILAAYSHLIDLNEKWKKQGDGVTGGVLLVVFAFAIALFLGN